MHWALATDRVHIYKPLMRELTMECYARLAGTAFIAACQLLILNSSVGAEETAPITSAFEGFELQEVDEVISDYSDEEVTLVSACCEPSCEVADCCDDVGCGDLCGCGAAKKPKPNPCTTSHKGLFYANDFSYLKDPCNKHECLGDCLKLMPVDKCGRWGTLDIGGQLRLRYHNEDGMGQSAGQTRFQDTTNDFTLSRIRLYTNWKVNDNVRVFAEGIYADVTGSDNTYISRGIDTNYGDLLNLFVDVKLTDKTTVRVGRQELLYGNQRVVSPLDWANTRRTFEGIRVLHKRGDWSIDGFYTNFVPVVDNQFDEADYDRSFYGVYSTYKACENHSLDLYYLGFDDERAAGDFSLHTTGLRMYGKTDSGWLYELEGAPQFGDAAGGVGHSAAFCTAGIGRKLDMAWDPTVWLFYDYASGNVPGGDFNRFNQLFPLAHKYLGFIDATQRSNIESPNILVKMAPHKKIDLLIWYYHLMANQAGDIVPSIGGTPAQSTASTDWGDEIDLIVKYKINPRSNILFGYSKFWAGNKITPPGGAVDAEFFYTQWTMNF